MGECIDDLPPHADASGQHDRHLAVRRQGALSALRIGEPASDEPETPHPGLAGGDTAHVASHDLRARAHDHRSHRRVVAHVVATDHGGGLRGVGGATQEAEERELLDGADLVLTASQLSGERDGDRAGAQGMAEALTGPEIHGERHRRE